MTKRQGEQSATARVADEFSRKMTAFRISVSSCE